jgi:hypothetical protein
MAATRKNYNNIRLLSDMVADNIIRPGQHTSLRDTLFQNSLSILRNSEDASGPLQMDYFRSMIFIFFFFFFIFYFFFF